MRAAAAKEKPPELPAASAIIPSAEWPYPDQRAVQEGRERERHDNPDHGRDEVLPRPPRRADDTGVAVASPAGREHGDGPGEKSAEQDDILRAAVRQQVSERPQADAGRHRMPERRLEMRAR